MKHKKIIIIALVVVVAAVICSVFWFSGEKNKTTPSSKEPLTISGKVTRISNECFSDGICSVTLDEAKTIITGCGLRANGTSCKTYDQSKLKSGQQVEATVMQAESGTYNLECDSCTIRPTN